MSFLNSRKVSWIIFGITLLTAVVKFIFSAGYYTGSFWHIRNAGWMGL